jgi:hypothetical protein
VTDADNAAGRQIRDDAVGEADGLALVLADGEADALALSDGVDVTVSVTVVVGVEDASSEPELHAVASRAVAARLAMIRERRPRMSILFPEWSGASAPPTVLPVASVRTGHRGVPPRVCRQVCGSPVAHQAA